MDLENLSERDRAVLRSIFDPTATIGDVADDGDKFVEEVDEATSEASQRSVELCAGGVALAEAGKMAEALQLIDEGVNADPGRAGGYNDRAQLLRLMMRDEDAMHDLLMGAEKKNWKEKKNIGCNARHRPCSRSLALCQRGVLMRKAGRADDARAAFAEAAKLGSSFARKQVAELNPYAALCNQMLSQVLRGDKDIKL